MSFLWSNPQCPSTDRIITNHCNQEHEAVCSIRHLSVCFHSIFWTDWPLNTCVCGIMITAHLRLKVKITGKGQRSMSSVEGRGNAVVWSVRPQYSTEKLFSSANAVSWVSFRLKWTQRTEADASPTFSASIVLCVQAFLRTDGQLKLTNLRNLSQQYEY